MYLGKIVDEEKCQSRPATRAALCEHGRGGVQLSIYRSHLGAFPCRWHASLD